MLTPISHRFLKLLIISGGLTLVSTSTWATTNLSCTVQTSINTTGHVEVLPIQKNKFQLTDDEAGVFTIPIDSTLFTYKVYVGFTADPAYDEMSDEGTPGFTPERTIHSLLFIDGNGLGVDTYTNRFKVHDMIHLSASMRTERASTYVSIFCHFRQR